jgi:hypothetical protein
MKVIKPPKSTVSLSRTLFGDDDALPPDTEENNFQPNQDDNFAFDILSRNPEKQHSYDHERLKDLKKNIAPPKRNYWADRLNNIFAKYTSKTYQFAVEIAALLHKDVSYVISEFPGDYIGSLNSGSITIKGLLTQMLNNLPHSQSQLDVQRNKVMMRSIIKSIKEYLDKHHITKQTGFPPAPTNTASSFVPLSSNRIGGSGTRLNFLEDYSKKTIDDIRKAGTAPANVIQTMNNTFDGLVKEAIDIIKDDKLNDITLSIPLVEYNHIVKNITDILDQIISVIQIRNNLIETSYNIFKDRAKFAGNLLDYTKVYADPDDTSKGQIPTTILMHVINMAKDFKINMLNNDIVGSNPTDKKIKDAYDFVKQLFDSKYSTNIFKTLYSSFEQERVVVGYSNNVNVYHTETEVSELLGLLDDFNTNSGASELQFEGWTNDPDTIALLFFRDIFHGFIKIVHDLITSIEGKEDFTIMELITSNRVSTFFAKAIVMEYNSSELNQRQKTVGVGDRRFTWDNTRFQLQKEITEKQGFIKYFKNVFRESKIIDGNPQTTLVYKQPRVLCEKRKLHVGDEEFFVSKYHRSS